MPNPDGSFIWYELLTPDPDAAKTFYDAVVGWNIGARVYEGMDYRMIQPPQGSEAGGVMRLTDEMAAGGARPTWLGYLAARDVDAKAKEIADAGGTIIVPPTDIPGVGRFAMATDPGGAPFYIMRGDSPEDSRAFSPDQLGHCAWNELYAPDQDAALAFYGKLFGIEKSGAMPMGEMGDYTFLRHAGVDIGALMTVQGEQPPAWNFYFHVPDIEVAAATVAEKGGTVHHGPQEVPGGSRIIIASDPQGAMFSLVAPGSGSHMEAAR